VEIARRHPTTRFAVSNWLRPSRKNGWSINPAGKPDESSLRIYLGLISAFSTRPAATSARASFAWARA
jgi:hypothetical protein